MRIVVLAAGMGQRLGGDLPKPLTLLASGESILERQMRLLTNHFSLSDIRLVVGYEKEQIQTAFPSIQTVENLAYAKQNTSKSLLCALEGLDDDLIWLNGDVVFRDTVLKGLALRQQSAMLVNKGPVADEEVKYSLASDGSISEVSKQVIGGLGEAVGINRVQREDLPLFREKLRLCGEQDYFEKALEALIVDGVKLWPVTVAMDDCIEVDFPEDLVRANQLIASWGK